MNVLVAIIVFAVKVAAVTTGWAWFGEPIFDLELNASQVAGLILLSGTLKMNFTPQEMDEITQNDSSEMLASLLFTLVATLFLWGLMWFYHAFMY